MIEGERRDKEWGERTGEEEKGKKWREGESREEWRGEKRGIE